MNRRISCLLAALPVVALLLTVSCRQGTTPTEDNVGEDKTAKKLLQGVWINEDEELVFKAEGDTLFYPDSISQPSYFKIVGDTLVVYSANVTKYPIVRQTEHTFSFRNFSGDVVKLQKSEDNDATDAFQQNQPATLNQRQLIKRDTVIVYNGERYHCYLQVNPTTYKVIKTTYNDDGVEVGNVYYDNILHLSFFHGANKVYSSNFVKNDFSKFVPAEYLKQSVLSDMTFVSLNDKGVTYLATICIPDTPSSYVVKVNVSFDGKMTMEI